MALGQWDFSILSVFFNGQYFTNRLISDFDIWHVDKHEWKKQASLTGFLKKFLFGKMSHFGPRNCASLLTLYPLEEFFLIFYTRKGVNR